MKASFGSHPISFKIILNFSETETFENYEVTCYTIRYDTTEEFNVDSKAVYTA